MDGSICCTDVQVTHDATGTTPPYHHRCWLLNFELIAIWMVLFLFGLEDTTAMISKNYLKCGLVRSHHITLFHCSSVHLRWARARESGCDSGCCWYMAFTLQGRVLNCACRLLTDSGFLKRSCGNILDRMMSVSDAVPPEGSKVTGSQCWYLASRFLQILWIFTKYYGL